jgi:glutaredoxin
MDTSSRLSVTSVHTGSRGIHNVMIYHDYEKPHASKIELWFDTIMEISIGVLPLVLVVLGIGMMSFSPRRGATPLFSTQNEAREYYKGIGIEYSSEVPIVLTSNSCPSCQSFQASLQDLGIPFSIANIDANPGAASLFATAQAQAGARNLPQVVLGDHLINPAPYSVKLAVRRAKAP